MATVQEFVLVVEGIDLDDDAAIDAVYEAGCDDCLIGFQHGRTSIHFDREAETLDQAVATAVAQLVPIGISVLSIDDPDGRPIDLPRMPAA